jgi:hypothetical protein
MLPGVKRAIALALLVAVAAGCATWRSATEQRTTRGPNARQMYLYRVGIENNREPTFDEWRFWEDQQERRIARFLVEHPEIANRTDVQTFRFEQQATVGMTKDQIVIILGQPETKTAAPAEMEKLARRYWPQIKGQASEAWVYPLGWRLYFADSKLVDMTQYRPAESFLNQNQE